MTREEAIARFGPVLNMDEAIELAGSYGHELDDLIDAEKVTVYQRTSDDFQGGERTILNYVLADQLFDALGV